MYFSKPIAHNPQIPQTTKAAAATTTTTTTTAAAAATTTTTTTTTMKIQQMRTCIDTKTDHACDIPTPFLFTCGFTLLFLLPNNEPLL